MIERIRDKDAATAMPDEARSSAATPTPSPAKPDMAAANAPAVEMPSAIPQEELDRLQNDLVAAFKTVYDPEIPVDIYELGLIYRVEIDDDRNIDIDMTLTAPGCPVAGEMPVWVENAASSVAGVGQVKVNLVFDPPWDMSRMSDEAKVALNVF